MDERENISRTYEIMGILDQTTTPTTYLNWLIHDPEQADIPKHEICADDGKWSKPKEGKNKFIVVFRTSGSKSKIDAYLAKRTDFRYWDLPLTRCGTTRRSMVYGQRPSFRGARENSSTSHGGASKSVSE